MRVRIGKRLWLYDKYFLLHYRNPHRDEDHLHKAVQEVDNQTTGPWFAKALSVVRKDARNSGMLGGASFRLASRRPLLAKHRGRTCKPLGGYTYRQAHCCHKMCWIPGAGLVVKIAIENENNYQTITRVHTYRTLTIARHCCECPTCFNLLNSHDYTLRYFCK